MCSLSSVSFLCCISSLSSFSLLCHRTTELKNPRLIICAKDSTFLILPFLPPTSHRSLGTLTNTREPSLNLSFNYQRSRYLISFYFFCFAIRIVCNGENSQSVYKGERKGSKTAEIVVFSFTFLLICCVLFLLLSNLFDREF